MSASFYEVLGVSRTADKVVIAAAYRAMMRKHHPDLNPDPAAEATAKSVTLAFQVLSDDGRRAAYDRELDAAARAGARGPWADRADPPVHEAPFWPEARPVRTARPRGRPLLGVLALVLALGAGGLGAKALLAGPAAGGLFARLGSLADAPAKRPSCAMGLGGIFRLPGEIRASFGDLSQILKVEGAAGGGGARAGAQGEVQRPLRSRRTRD